VKHRRRPSDYVWSWGISRGALKYPDALTIMRVAKVFEWIEARTLGPLGPR